MEVEGFPYDPHDYGNTDIRNTVNSVAKVEISERTLSIIAFGLSVASLAFSMFVFAEWKVAERESRMLQYYLLELDAKFIAGGLKKPEDSIANKLKEK